jgi:hypothetical protein
VRDALVEEPGDARHLDAVCNIPDGGDVGLRIMLRLCRGRAALAQGRLDEATAAFDDARNQADTLGDTLGKRLLAEARFRSAEIEETRARTWKPCGADLGLRRLATLSGQDLRARLSEATAAYQLVVQSRQRFWSRRAAFRIAALYDDFYRGALDGPPSLRSAALPNPFAVDEVEVGALLASVQNGWPAELARMYTQIGTDIDLREPDAVLERQLHERTVALGRRTPQMPELVTNPWHVGLRDGVIRFNRRFEKYLGGRFIPMGTPEAREKLEKLLSADTDSVEHAYALVALAEGGPAPDIDVILDALEDDDPRMRLAGLVAAEHVPDRGLYDSVINVWTDATKDTKASELKLFSTVSAALYGEPERALLALRALALKDRETALRLVSDPALPAAERAWIVAEIGDSNVVDTWTPFATDRDPRVAALGTFGAWLANGHNAVSMLRTSDPGVVGCVSRLLQRLDDDAERKKKEP